MVANIGLTRRVDMKKTKRGWLFGLLAFILIIGCVYVYQVAFFNDHFFPKTVANGVSLDKLTVAEAEKKLVANADKDTFTLLDNDNTWKSIPKKDLGITANYTVGLNKIIHKQNAFAWIPTYFNRRNYVLMDASLNEEKLNNTLQTVRTDLEKLNETRTVTQNASIKKEGDTFQIIPEVVGNNLEIDTLIKDLTAALKTGKKSQIQLENYQIKPTVLENDSSLTKSIEKINKIVNQSVTYSIAGETITVPKEQLADWIDYDNEKNQVALNQEKVTNYVAALGADYNTSTNPTTFKSTKRGEVSVPAGTLSWTIQTTEETAALTADILKGDGVSRTPITQGSTTPDKPLIGNTYVEVDRQNQHMYVYKNGALVLDTDIVTGKPTTPTPLGVFYIWSKERNSTLRGTNDDGSPYASPVDYWMPIDWTGVGIHDSPWQSAYGGSRWQTHGSHGCINTPPAKAGQLFNAVEVGTPVIVF